MFWLKGCPRCNGDLYEDKDIHGSYIACLQCSKYLTADDEAKLRSAASLNDSNTCEISVIEAPGITAPPMVALPVVAPGIFGGLEAARILELSTAA